MIDKLDAAGQRLEQLTTINAQMAEPVEQKLLQVTENHYPENPFFTPDVLKATLNTFGKNIRKETIAHHFSSLLHLTTPSPKKALAIVPGNNPLGGFTDLVRAVLFEYTVILRLPPENKRILPALVNFIQLYIPKIKELVTFTEGFLKEPDVIFTHELDENDREMRKYFGRYKGIVREKRRSGAVLTGEEKEVDLKNLADGVLTYFGQCRHNITKIFIPQEYRLDDLLKSFSDWSYLKDHNKYRNNYDYYKSIYLINRENFFDNETILLKEAAHEVISPLGVLYFEKYAKEEELNNRLAAQQMAFIYGKGNSFPDFWHPDLFAAEDNIQFLKAMG